VSTPMQNLAVKQHATILTIHLLGTMTKTTARMAFAFMTRSGATVEGDQVAPRLQPQTYDNRPAAVASSPDLGVHVPHSRRRKRTKTTSKSKNTPNSLGELDSDGTVRGGHVLVEDDWRVWEVCRVLVVAGTDQKTRMSEIDGATERRSDGAR
jgi:hypothetical protein